MLTLTPVIYIFTNIFTLFIYIMRLKIVNSVFTTTCVFSHLQSYHIGYLRLYLQNILKHHLQRLQGELIVLFT